MQKSYPFFPSSLFLSIVTYAETSNLKKKKKKKTTKNNSLFYSSNLQIHYGIRTCQLKNSNSAFNPSNSSMLKPNFHLVVHHKLSPLEDSNET